MSARGERAYVSNEDGNSVSVIDTQTAQVIATIDVGKRPRGMKIDRAGARLFVAVSGLPKCPPTVPDEECAKRKRDLSADGIAIIDTASHKVRPRARGRLGSRTVRPECRRDAPVRGE